MILRLDMTPDDRGAAAPAPDVEAIAVCFLYSFLDPGHERLAVR